MWNSGELDPSPNSGINRMTLGRSSNLMTLKFIISQMRCFQINISSAPVVLWLSFLKILKEVFYHFFRNVFLSILIKVLCVYILLPLLHFDHILTAHPEELWSVFPFILLTITLNGCPLLYTMSQYSFLFYIFIPSLFLDKAYRDPDSTQRNVPAFRVSRHR